MQLLIILALLLYGGKNNAGNILSEVKPVLETLGGEQMQEALKSAEEISSVLSAVQGFASPANASEPAQSAFNFSSERQQPAIAFPLAPVSAIADKDITYSLSRYISQN